MSKQQWKRHLPTKRRGLGRRRHGGYRALSRRAVSRTLQSSGFTLLEVMIVAFILSILMLIMAPAWNNLLLRQQLSTAQSHAHQVLRQAQLEAIHRRTPWQVSFRQIDDQVEWASHAATLAPTKAAWQPLTSTVKIDTKETTFPKASGIYRMRFNYLGSVQGQLGRLTFTGQNGSRIKRCVFVSTLLGVLRDAHNQRTPDQGGRYCY